jgi:hypothetical protein
MPRDTAPNAGILSGDSRIDELLAREDTHTLNAFACRLDGFVNDTFTEYANASVYRPASVCQARLVSHLHDVIHVSGTYHLGFVAYVSAGVEEAVDIWIGHRRVAVARHPDPDNRRHLFFVPEKFTFRGGERIRLVTHETDGPCRIETIALLPTRPRTTEPKLTLSKPDVDLRHEGDRLFAHISWITNRPASGTLRWGQVGDRFKTVRIKNRSAHEVSLLNLTEDRTYRYEIDLRSGDLHTTHAGSFTPRSTGRRRTRRDGRFTLQDVRGTRIPWPVSMGLPFPQGAVTDPASIRLLDRENHTIPSQSRPLSHWPDGSVRWMLTDFTSAGRAGIAVEYGRKPQPPNNHGTLLVQNRRGECVVTTGPLRVRFPKDRTILPGLIERLDHKTGTYLPVTPANAAPAVALCDGRGRVYQSLKPESVLIEEAGPERVCVRIDVAHRNRKGEALFASTFRIHLYRNSTRIKVLHTFVNDSDDEFNRVRSLALRVDAPLGREAVAQTEGQRLSMSDGPISLTQTHDDRFFLTQNDVVKSGKRSKGAVSVSGEKITLSLACRDFWENYPKGFRVDPKGLTLDICPPLVSKDYPKGGDLEDRLYYYLLDGRYTFKQGVSRTHEFWMDYGKVALTTFVNAVNRPPLHRFPLSVLNNSKAWTRLPSKDPSPFEPYESWVDAAQSAYAKDRVESRAYGMLNFGDWFGERTYNWGNVEYDTPWCFLQEYLRGGHEDFFNWADQAARHLVDVDTCHAGKPDLLNNQYLHSVGHVGNYYPDGYRETAIFTGRTSVSHTWVEGLFLHHLLTGDPRSQEAASKTCDNLVGEIVNNYDFTNCRNSGWHLIHLSAAYRATGRRIFLNAARIIVDRVVERQRASGGWDRLMVPGHCHCDPPRHTGNAGFMVAILTVGLKRYHEVTEDSRVADAIVAASDYCIQRMWVPEASAFHYTCCPESRVSAAADLRILKAVAAAYEFTGEDRFKEVLLAGIETAIGHPPRAGRGIGKGICSPMRGAPQVVAVLPH